MSSLISGLEKFFIRLFHTLINVCQSWAFPSSSSSFSAYRFGELSILYKAKRFASIRGELIDSFIPRHATQTQTLLARTN